MDEFIHVPVRVFTDPDLTYVTQSLGMWLCFLCSKERTLTITTTLAQLEGHVGEHLTRGDIYRLERIGLIHATEHPSGNWTIELKA